MGRGKKSFGLGRWHLATVEGTTAAQETVGGAAVGGGGGYVLWTGGAQHGYEAVVGGATWLQQFVETRLKGVGQLVEEVDFVGDSGFLPTVIMR